MKPELHSAVPQLPSDDIEKTAVFKCIDKPFAAHSTLSHMKSYPLSLELREQGTFYPIYFLTPFVQ